MTKPRKTLTAPIREVGATVETGTQLGYLRFQPAPKAFLDVDTGRYGMQPRTVAKVAKRIAAA